MYAVEETELNRVLFEYIFYAPPDMEALILYDKLPKDFRVQKYISTFAEDILHARCSVPEPITQCGGTSPCSSNGALLLLTGALQCVLERGGIQLPQLPEL